MQSIRRLPLLAPEDSGRVKFDVDKDHFEISTVNKETGEAKEFIDKYEYNGVPTSISFNNKYLLSILDAIDTEQVLIN
jgi:DNA polymerase III sliding clamp (beta) subunit (PCNA family)